MKGEWEETLEGICEEGGNVPRFATYLTLDEMTGICNRHNEALRAAVEDEREGCLMDVLGELESRGFYSMASRVRAVIHAREAARDTG